MHIRKALSPSQKTGSTTSKEVEDEVTGDEDDKILNEMEKLTSVMEREKKCAKKLLAKRRAKVFPYCCCEKGYSVSLLTSESVDTVDDDEGEVEVSEDEEIHDEDRVHSSSDIEDSDEERRRYDEQMEDLLDNA
ncbi:hypothetical protein L6164_031905 [Bauhinia variegata]|uniref:Uncharacterized protein n=1 Tax=Bauhinia variegata TaxID=167791 RepID=A0ACB9KM59_BAUVA|nr:hypothetical protein L6164_031905 [Bauhinia variegata]